jgi:hypothetical protein
MSVKQDSIVGSILHILRNRPDIVLMILVVGSFLFYMHKTAEMAQNAAMENARRQDAIAETNATRADKVADQRITTCHDIQLLGIDAIKKNTDALIIHSGASIRLSEEIDTLTITVTGFGVDLSVLRDDVNTLINAVTNHEKFTILHDESKF